MTKVLRCFCLKVAKERNSFVKESNAILRERKNIVRQRIVATRKRIKFAKQSRLLAMQSLSGLAQYCVPTCLLYLVTKSALNLWTPNYIRCSSVLFVTERITWVTFPQRALCVASSLKLSVPKKCDVCHMHMWTNCDYSLFDHQACCIQDFKSPRTSRDSDKFSLTYILEQTWFIFH